MSIKMDVINDEAQHFTVVFDRPGRIEVLVVDGKVIAHVYEGAEIDTDQEPLGVYDATLIAHMIPGGSPYSGSNKSWGA